MHWKYFQCSGETMGLHEGLTLAANLLSPMLAVEMDAKTDINLITSCHSDCHPLSSLLYDCRCLVRRLKVEKINHVFREANHCADALAKLGCYSNCRMSIYDSAPSCITSLLEEDFVGTLVPRLY